MGNSQKTRRYYQNKHLFFDQLVAYLGSLISFGVSIRSHSTGYSFQLSQNDNIIIQGKSKVSNLEFKFYPYDLLQKIISGDWPHEIMFYEQSIRTHPKNIYKIPQKIKGTQKYHSCMIMFAFIHYFESIRRLIESKLDKDSQTWPSVWSFGRVIRNAFAHGGEIKIDNPNAPPVSWMNLTYSPKDNGRQIIFVDMNPVEIILLMEEMDSLLY